MGGFSQYIFNGGIVCENIIGDAHGATEKGVVNRNAVWSFSKIPRAENYVIFFV
jgi:hypothetical protein